MRTTEAILHCSNLYRALGVEPGTSVVLTIRHVGVRDYNLSSTQNNFLTIFPARNLYEDEVRATATFHVGISEPEIIKVVKSLCEPLFMVFDFKRFEDSIYNQIVAKFIQGKM